MTMIDEDGIAARLFGGSTPGPGSEPASPAQASEKTKTELQLAESIWGRPAPPAPELSEAVRALRDTPERRLFDAGKGSTLFAEGALDLPEYLVDREEAVRVGADLGATGDEMRAFSTLVVQHRDIDQETFDSWHRASVAMIGREISQADLDLAKQFVARDPRVHEYLARSGLGSNPDVVRQAIALAKRERSRGEV